ncbi:hypothetical protein [Streptomyces sp. SAI-229]|uniref:hypothetical protein n=1 Tax=Streptomyces sp. SAI-229 TaxID=3377731 RepID=UPI003C7A58AB
MSHVSPAGTVGMSFPRTPVAVPGAADGVARGRPRATPVTGASPGVFAAAPRYEPRGVAAGPVVPGAVDTLFLGRRVHRQRSRPGPVPSERAPDAVRSAVSRGRDESRVPGRPRLPVRVGGAAPGLGRRPAAVSG